MSFYQIPEKFWQNLKLGRFLAKNGHLVRFSHRHFERPILVKMT